MKESKFNWWFLWCSICVIIAGALWFSRTLIQPEKKEITTNTIRLLRQKLKNNSDWLRYQELQQKLFKLNRGWLRPNVNAKPGLEPALPIDKAIEEQITEIKRIHDEEILGKLSDSNRILQEYQQKLWDDLEKKYQEKLSAARTVLETDLEVKRRRQTKILEDFRQDQVREQQLTIVNLELELKVIGFNPIDPEKQQNEKERIETELARIRNDIKKKVDLRADELEKEFNNYQKQRFAEFQAEINGYRKQMIQEYQLELYRFRERQTKEFESWDKQRQIEVNRAIEMRRSQK